MSAITPSLHAVSQRRAVPDVPRHVPTVFSWQPRDPSVGTPHVASAITPSLPSISRLIAGGDNHGENPAMMRAFLGKGERMVGNAATIDIVPRRGTPHHLHMWRPPLLHAVSQRRAVRAAKEGVPAYWHALQTDERLLNLKTLNEAPWSPTEYHRP